MPWVIRTWQQLCTLVVFYNWYGHWTARTVVEAADLTSVRPGTQPSDP